jgi:hypothetical protein
MIRSDCNRLHRAIDTLLLDQSPRREAANLDREEQRLVRIAQLLRGSQGQSASPEFVDRLHGDLFHQ